MGAFLLMVSDTVLGIAVAVQSGAFTSFGMRKFFRKASVYFAVVIASYGIDCVFRTGQIAQTMIMVMICLTEASSVFENSAVLGFKWPTKLRDQVLRMEKTLRQEGGDDDGDERESLCDMRGGPGSEGDRPKDGDGQWGDL
jgi:phage-related holin